MGVPHLGWPWNEIEVDGQSGKGERGSIEAEVGETELGERVVLDELGRERELSDVAEGETRLEPRGKS